MEMDTHVKIVRNRRWILNFMKLQMLLYTVFSLCDKITGFTNFRASSFPKQPFCPIKAAFLAIIATYWDGSECSSKTIETK